MSLFRCVDSLYLSPVVKVQAFFCHILNIINTNPNEQSESVSAKMLSLIPFFLLASLSYANPISPQAAQAGSIDAGGARGKPASEGVTSFDGQDLARIAPAPAAAAVMAAAISSAGWTVTVDSEQAENPGTNAIDGNMATIWHTQFNPTVAPLPHTFTINMQNSYLIGSITYNPRQDGGLNGNIGQHTIQVR